MPQADVFQQIRSQFERKTLPPLCPGGCTCTKVLARNDVHFISDLPDKWLVDYERRQGHRHTGFFAYNHLPYKTFANLKHTDVYDLIGEQLGVAITKHQAYSHAFSRHHFIQDHEEDCSNACDPQLMIKVVHLSSQHEPLPHSINAGLSSLRLALGANKRSTQEMNAGSAFRDVLRREDERNVFLQDIRAPKVVKQPGGQSCQVHNPSLFLPPMVHTASSKACLTLSDTFRKKLPRTLTCQGGRGEGGKGAVQVEDYKEGVGRKGNCEGAASRTVGVGPNLYVALAAAHFKLHHTAHLKGQEHRTQIGSVRYHQRRQCLAKVKSVYAILCCLHNIRMRDLRTKEPLTAAVILAISQCPLHSIAKDTHDTYHHHPHLHTPGVHHSWYNVHTPTFHHHHPSHHPHYPHQPHHQSSVLHHGGLLTHEPSLEGAHRHNPHTHTHHTKHHTQLTPHYKPHTHTASRHVKIQTDHHIETWEDILSVDAGAWVKGHTPLHANIAHLPHPPQQLHSTATLHHHHGYGGVHYKPNRSLPPWQRQVVYVDTEDDKRRCCPEKQIHDCVDAFQQCKNQLAHDMATTLTARNPNLQRHLVAKLQSLALRQRGGSVEECLEGMRQGAYHAGREDRAGEEMKPAWYAQLEKEVCGVCELWRDKEGRGALERLHQFLCVDNNAIPHAIEKLCLLVMSLPANQVCFQPVISAIQFVLKYILKAPPHLYSQWLDLRKLPQVTTELPQQVYLFGMPV